MSADAKIWADEGYGWLAWRGIHDGECISTIPHFQGDTLANVLQDIERCMGRQLRWEVLVYPDGRPGLRGFEA